MYFDRLYFFVLVLYIKVLSDCSPLELGPDSCVSVNMENKFHELEA